MFKRGNKGSSTGTTGSRMHGAGGMAKLAGGVPLLLLALAAWVVALAGISVIRHAAGTDNVYGGLSFTWFVIFFDLFVLLAALMHLVGVGVGRVPIGHAAIASLLAVATVLTYLQTNTWYLARKTVSYSTLIGSGVVTLFAGFIALSVLLSLLIIILGNQHTVDHNNTDIHSNAEYGRNNADYGRGTGGTVGGVTGNNNTPVGVATGPHVHGQRVQETV